MTYSPHSSSTIVGPFDRLSLLLQESFCGSGQVPSSVERLPWSSSEVAKLGSFFRRRFVALLELPEPLISKIIFNRWLLAFPGPLLSQEDDCGCLLARNC